MKNITININHVYSNNMNTLETMIEEIESPVND